MGVRTTTPAKQRRLAIPSIAILTLTTTTTIENKNITITHDSKKD